MVWLRTLRPVFVGQLRVAGGELVRAEGYGKATRRVWVRVGHHEGWVDVADLVVASPPPTALERLGGPEVV